MIQHIALSALLAEKPGQQLLVDADNPMPVLHLDVPWICTAVLERTAVLASTTDPRERYPIRHEYVMVDPANARWMTAQAVKFNGGKNRATKEQRQAARDKTDREALKNQADVARLHDAELKRDRELALKETSMPDVLKHCPGCKKDKPRSEFPDGKGYFQCNECRAAKPPLPPRPYTPTTATQTSARVGRIVKSEEGLKFCPHCKEEKPVDGFGLNTRKADGRQSVCKECRSKIWSAGSTAMGHARAAKTGDPGAQLKVVVNGLRQLIANLRSENERLKHDLASAMEQLQEVLA